jgi:hypothetical protein
MRLKEINYNEEFLILELIKITKRTKSCKINFMKERPQFHLQWDFFQDRNHSNFRQKLETVICKATL